MTDELTDIQEQELAEALRALKVELSAGLTQSEASARPVDLDGSIGRVTRIDALQQQAMALAGRRNATARLAGVERALARLANGDYGFCRRCEEPIGYRRLRHQPDALYCLDCQASTERR